MSKITAWASLGGLVIAIVAGLYNPDTGFPFGGAILLILGLVAGFALKTKEAQKYIIYGLGLALGAAALATLSSVSGLLELYVSGVFAHVITLTSSVVLAVSLKALYGYFWPK